MAARRWNPATIADMLTTLENTHGKSRYIPRFDPMDELISCILSQHTTDAHSFPAFTQLRERYPTWQDVANAPAAEVASTVRLAGLSNQKAKNIIGSLQKINEQFGDFTLDALRTWPTDEAMAWLQTLPGVGPKTASIVLCFAMGRETIPVDTHVFRVSWRLGLIKEEIGEVKAHGVLMKLVPRELAFPFHTLLIQHGRTVCRAPLPVCEKCGLADRCAWLKSDGPGKRQREMARTRKRSLKARRAKKGEVPVGSVND
ncbi:Nth Predicted EndoIII-related endonuclease [Fimbriimonadaceae bacterium]